MQHVEVLTAISFVYARRKSFAYGGNQGLTSLVALGVNEIN